MLLNYKSNKKNTQKLKLYNRNSKYVISVCVKSLSLHSCSLIDVLKMIPKLHLGLFSNVCYAILKSKSKKNFNKYSRGLIFLIHWDLFQTNSQNSTTLMGKKKMGKLYTIKYKEAEI